MIGMGTIGLGTSSHTATVSYAPIMEKYLGVPVRTMPSDSTKVSFSQIREKKALFSALSTSSLGVALQGDHPYHVEGWGPQRLGLVWMGYEGPFGFFVRGDSPIKSIKDLKGKKVAWYFSSPAWILGAEGVLRFGGLTLKDVELVRLGSYAACARAVVEGKADADYVSAVSAVTFEIAESPSGIRFLPMPLEDKGGWARYNEINPLIPWGICEKGVKVARGIPMANHVFCNATYLDADPEHIYHVARFFGEAYDQYKDLHIENRDMSLKKMRALLDSRGLPVHPGTIKYLKEKNLWTVEDDKWNQEYLENITRYEKAWIAALKEAKAKGIKVELSNETWVKLWNDHRAKLPIFKMR
jgi:TRAP transporter TAXI family solute receptor